MDWIPVESSVFFAAAYVKAEQALYLRFRSGETYRYLVFMPGQFEEFLAAESQGRYFSAHIRDRFPCERLPRIKSTSSQ